MYWLYTRLCIWLCIHSVSGLHADTERIHCINTEIHCIVQLGYQVGAGFLDGVIELSHGYKHALYACKLGCRTYNKFRAASDHLIGRP